MSRPSTYADLAPHEKEGNTIFSWQYEVHKVPSIEQHLVRAKLEAQKLGFDIGSSDVRVPLTVRELDAKLLAIQEKWDDGRRIYEALVSGHQTIDDLDWSSKHRAGYYAERQGFLKPEDVIAGVVEVD